jgi:hypothetical protein
VQANDVRQIKCNHHCFRFNSGKVFLLKPATDVTAYLASILVHVYLSSMQLRV